MRPALTAEHLSVFTLTFPGGDGDSICDHKEKRQIVVQHLVSHQTLCYITEHQKSAHSYEGDFSLLDYCEERDGKDREIEVVGLFHSQEFIFKYKAHK